MGTPSGANMANVPSNSLPAGVTFGSAISQMRFSLCSKGAATGSVMSSTAIVSRDLWRSLTILRISTSVNPVCAM